MINKSTSHFHSFNKYSCGILEYLPYGRHSSVYWIMEMNKEEKKFPDLAELIFLWKISNNKHQT